MAPDEGSNLFIVSFRLRPPAWTEFGISTLIGREPMLTPHTITMLSEPVHSDSSRAIKELGYQPSSLKEMLMDCYTWMVETGMLARAPEVSKAV